MDELTGAAEMVIVVERVGPGSMKNGLLETVGKLQGGGKGR